MTIFLTILLVLAVLLAVVLIAALLMKKEHYVQREIVINAPQQKVFEFLKLLKNQEKFNKWAKAHPERKAETKGTDGTVGFMYSWNGNKSVGEGQKEITKIIEGRRIETEIRFVRPISTTAYVVMEMDTVGENQTKVTLSNGGKLNYPLNFMIPMAEKNFAKDLDESLATLKDILENSPRP